MRVVSQRLPGRLERLGEAMLSQQGAGQPDQGAGVIAGEDLREIDGPPPRP